MKIIALKKSNCKNVMFLFTGINMRDIRFVGLDGCNTMSGEHKGMSSVLFILYKSVTLISLINV